MSSRGLMIHTGRPIVRGNEVEIRRGDHVIIARVVWRDGARAGLKVEERVPIEEILTLGKSPALQLTAVCGERRKRPRLEERNRLVGRAVKFAGVLAIAVSLAGAGLIMVQEAFAGPFALVEAKLAP